MIKTIDCLQNIGKNVVIGGFISARRDHGHLMFLEIRDFYGIVQVVIENPLESYCLESVIIAQGTIRTRTDNQINSQMATGNIELVANAITLVSEAKNLPFLPEDNTLEDIRLEYRPIHLRSERMQYLLKFRSKLIVYLTNTFAELGFTYIQTPILTASSPEGARDFLVPSRLHPGKFYALPQSPQIFKQMLMVGGVDKYFQIAPCFRDEDSRKDRLYEGFYQLDLECSFGTQKMITETMFDVYSNLFKEFAPDKTVKTATKSWHECMRIYGSDKPDLRNPLILEDFTETFTKSNMDLFKRMINDGCIVKGIRCKNVNQPNKVLEYAEKNKFRIAFVNKQNGELKGPIGNFLKPEICGENECIFFICDHAEDVYKKCNIIRNFLGEYLNLIDSNTLYLLLVTDFPFFELKDGKLDFAHNPFSKPQSRDLDPSSLAYQYDFVLNGYEICSGSERNTDLHLLTEAFVKCGYSAEEVRVKFNSFESFKYGVPPHAGCATGIDRLIMILTNEANVRNVVAFPMNTNGIDHFMNAPSSVSSTTLRELGIKVIS